MPTSAVVGLGLHDADIQQNSNISLEPQCATPGGRRAIDRLRSGERAPETDSSCMFSLLIREKVRVSSSLMFELFG